MNSFEKVAWKSLNKNGTSGKESKSHLMELGAEKTLCGTAIPPQNQMSEEYLNGECKRCAKAAEKTTAPVAETTATKKAPAKVKKTPAVNVVATEAVVKYAFIDWLGQLNKNDTLPRGQFFKGKKVA